MKTPERRRRRSGVFIVNFEHISHLVLVFLLLTLKMYLPVGSTQVPVSNLSAFFSEEGLTADYCS